MEEKARSERLNEKEAWIQLMTMARDLGLTMEQVREMLQQITPTKTVDACVEVKLEYLWKDRIRNSSAFL